MGPGAGIHGGRIMAQGTFEELAAMPFSFSRRIGTEPMWKMYLKVAKRVVVLFLLGDV